MVMTSHDISALAQQQQMQFAQQQAYAQQFGVRPQPPGQGFSSMLARAPMSYGTPIPGMVGERMAGAAIGGLGTAGSALGTASMFAGMAGMVGAGGAGLALAGGLPAMAAIGAGTAGANELYTGYQQRAMVNQAMRSNFSGMRGVGQGPGGKGFSTQEMGNVSSMIREMATSDMFTSMDELVGVLDQTAQMGLYRGVQSAKDFRRKFKETTNALRDIAQVMNTSLEGATEFMNKSRQMGFFSGEDISRNLMQTRMTAGATGMSVQQVQQMGLMGAQLGRAMGMRGREGAGAFQEMGTNIAMAQRTGTLTDELVAEATGGLTGAAGTQALTATMMRSSNRWLRSGAGRSTLAAMWDPETGGINREVAQQISRGEITFQQARRMGQRNIRAGGGNRAEFFAQEERLRGQAMEEVGGDLQMAMVESHFGARRGGASLDDPIVQRWLRRRNRWSQAQVEAFVELRRDQPRIQQERRMRERGEARELGRQRQREVSGLGGFRRRMAQTWDREVTSPIRQVADDWVTSWSEGVEELVRDFEGRVEGEVSELTKKRITDFMRTGKGDLGFISSEKMAKLTARARAGGGAPGAYTLRGMARSLGESFGVSGGTTQDRMKAAGADIHGFTGGGPEEQARWLESWSRDLTTTPTQLGFTTTELTQLGTRTADLITASMDESRRDQFVRQSEDSSNAASLSRRRLKLVMQDTELKKAFAKARTYGEKYSLLGALERAGLGEGHKLAAPLGKMGVGGGGALIGKDISYFQQMQEQAIGMIARATSGAPEEDDALGAQALWGLTESVKEAGDVWGAAADVAKSWGLTTTSEALGWWADLHGQGTQLDDAAFERLMKNQSVATDLSLAVQGGKSGKEAVRRLRKAAGGGEYGQEVGVRTDDAQELEILLDRVKEKDIGVQRAIASFMLGRQGEGQSVLARRMRTEGREIMNWAVRQGDRLKEDVGEEVYGEFMRIQELRTSGRSEDMQEAFQLERDFYQKHGGTSGGNLLMSRLRQGGVGGGMQEGLATMSDYVRAFSGGTGRQRTKRLMQGTLQSFGLEARESRRILDRDLMGRIAGGKGGEEEARAISKEMVYGLSEEQLAKAAERGLGKEDLMKQVMQIVQAGGGGGTSMDELRDIFVGKAGAAATREALEGKETVTGFESKNYDQLKKTNIYLQVLVQSNSAANEILADMRKAAKNRSATGEGDVF